MDYPRTLVVFDAADPEQLKWLEASALSRDINTRLLITDGTYLKTRTRLSRHVYFAMPTIIQPVSASGSTIGDPAKKAIKWRLLKLISLKPKNKIFLLYPLPPDVAGSSFGKMRGKFHESHIGCLLGMYFPPSRSRAYPSAPA